MKLRDKKTGKVFDAKSELGGYNGGGQIVMTIHGADGCLVDVRHYNSLAELNEEWEDAEDSSVTPLIKDEKYRIAVLAWANANNATDIEIDSNGRIITWIRKCDDDVDALWIEFAGAPFTDIRNGIYDISELCGEPDYDL